MVKVKVKSAYEPSGLSGRNVSRFLSHEATRSISTLYGWNATIVDKSLWDTDVI